jgi:hypothetical protein
MVFLSPYVEEPESELVLALVPESVLDLESELVLDLAMDLELESALTLKVELNHYLYPRHNRLRKSKAHKPAPR